MFYSDLKKFNLNPWNGHTKDKKATAYDNGSELYNKYLEICFDQCMTLPDPEKRKLGNKYAPKKLFLGGNDYSVWSEELTDIHQCHH